MMMPPWLNISVVADESLECIRASALFEKFNGSLTMSTTISLHKKMDKAPPGDVIAVYIFTNGRARLLNNLLK